MNNYQSPFTPKSDNSQSNTVKNTPLDSSEYSFPSFLKFISAREKMTKGDTGLVTEVVFVVWMPALKKYKVVIWSVWGNQSLFLAILEQVNADSTPEKPLVLYSEHGAGKNNLYEIILQTSNRFSTYTHPTNASIVMTAQVLCCVFRPRHNY